MNSVLSKYLPMTETAFYILLVLKKPLHGYGIILSVDELTDGRIRIGAGTIYGTLSKMETDGLIASAGIVERRKLYEQTELGSQLIKEEIKRLNQLVEHAKRSGY